MTNMTGLTCRIVTTLALCLLLSGCAASERGRVGPSLSIVPLVTTREDGVADSQVVPIRFEDEDAWLALDTGAPFTFLFSNPDGPEYVEDAGVIEIGGKQWQVPGYRDEAIGVEMFQNKPIVGVLGLDFFTGVPAEIDYPGGRLVRYLDGRLPASDLGLPTMPLRGRESGRALIDVVLDETEMRLLFDTGAHDTILVNVAGDEDDELTQVQTADGRVYRVYVGEAILDLPAEGSRAVPVLRAPDLSYIAPELRETDTQGLFGLTSLGWRRVVLDFDAGVMRLGPRDVSCERPR